MSELEEFLEFVRTMRAECAPTPPDRCFACQCLIPPGKGDIIEDDDGFYPVCIDCRDEL